MNDIYYLLSIAKKCVRKTDFQYFCWSHSPKNLFMEFHSPKKNNARYIIVLCLTKEDVISISIRESREWNAAIVPPPSFCRINSGWCGLGMYVQEDVPCVISKHSSIRLNVLSAIIVEVYLALRCALDSAVEIAINSLGIFSKSQTLFGLINSKVRVSWIHSCHLLTQVSL